MRKYFYTFLINAVIPIVTYAQFSGTALTDYQYGKLPNESTNSFHSVYSKVDLNYQIKNIKLGTEVQLYQSPYSDRNYLDLSKARANYQNQYFNITLGNYNEVLGKGILLRNYEIPGAVIEDLSFRTKQYFYTDIIGGNFTFTGKKNSLKILWGYTLNNLYPPTQSWELRRSDEVVGMELNHQINKQEIEISGLRVLNDYEESYYGMLSLSGNISKSLNYYLGYAEYLDGEGKSNEEKDASAIYANISLSLEKFGANLEYKKYNKFLIGSGINEPPALVREHSYPLLNRSTHVLQPSDEKGIQLETFYQLDIFSLLTFNYTYAINQFVKDYRYHELFLEYSGLVFNESDLKLFADFANDPFKDEENRITLGFALDKVVNKSWGIIIEGEGQKFNRLNDGVNNYMMSITARNKSKLYAGIITEWSNDSYITEKNKWWFGANMRYKATNNHTLQLFAGERRGGPACSAGVCYEVLDFKGLELRWIARF